MSMVPLNFGAAAPLRLKPQLLQVVAVSGFWAPQFGQYKPHLHQQNAPLWGDESLPPQVKPHKVYAT